MEEGSCDWFWKKYMDKKWKLLVGYYNNAMNWFENKEYLQIIVKEKKLQRWRNSDRKH